MNSGTQGANTKQNNPLHKPRVGFSIDQILGMPSRVVFSIDQILGIERRNNIGKIFALFFLNL